MNMDGAQWCPPDLLRAPRSLAAAPLRKPISSLATMVTCLHGATPAAVNQDRLVPPKEVHVFRPRQLHLRNSYARQLYICATLYAYICAVQQHTYAVAVAYSRYICMYISTLYGPCTGCTGCTLYASAGNAAHLRCLEKDVRQKHATTRCCGARIFSSSSPFCNYHLRFHRGIKIFSPNVYVSRSALSLCRFSVIH